jgi:hypothetical protein
MEDPFSARAERSRLPGALQDAVVEEALALCAELGVPAYLNRYISRAVGLDEYVTDLDRIYHDRRFAGFDVYEFVHLARPNDRGELAPVGARLERLRAKAGELGFCPLGFHYEDRDSAARAAGVLGVFWRIRR